MLLEIYLPVLTVLRLHTMLIYLLVIWVHPLPSELTGFVPVSVPRVK